MDKVSLFWSCFCVFLGAIALLRSNAIGRAMRQVHEQAKMQKILTVQELRERTTLYIRLFGIVWITVGLFWIGWMLYHRNHH